MKSLKGRFGLLVGGAALLVILAAAGLFWALHATEATLERTLGAQHRLDLLAELSGRIADYGLAAVDTVNSSNSSAPSPERLGVQRAEVHRALTQVEVAIMRGAAEANTPGPADLANRGRLLARLQAAINRLDADIEHAIAQPDASLRGDAIRGALNAFAAMTGPSLSFLVDGERRGIELASADARTLATRLRAGAALAAAIALAAVAFIHRTMTRPLFARLSAIQKAALAIARGELGTRLPTRARDELGLLGAHFNRMAARLARREREVARERAALEETIAQRTEDLVRANEQLATIDQARRRFFADVSHELRTPLTVILGECDISLRMLSSDDEDYRNVLTTIRKRAQRLHRRVEDLLRVARSESGRIELDLRPISVSSVLAEAVEAMSAEARRRDIALTLEPGPADLEVLADRDWLRQIVEGLIDNALRHAVGASRVLLSLEERGYEAEIAVTDDGAGFPAAGEELFERFARAPERKDASGFGIGLALARWVVERHHGEIRLEQSPDGNPGARVVIRIPLERKEQVA
jgi:signal transduction histidine kinase